MENEKKVTTRAKKIWADHKTKILTATTVLSTTTAVVMRIAIKQHDDFLREKGLYEEFYTEEEN